MEFSRYGRGAGRFLNNPSSVTEWNLTMFSSIFCNFSMLDNVKQRDKRAKKKFTLFTVKRLQDKRKSRPRQSKIDANFICLLRGRGGSIRIWWPNSAIRKETNFWMAPYFFKLNSFKQILTILLYSTVGTSRNFTTFFE